MATTDLTPAQVAEQLGLKFKPPLRRGEGSAIARAKQRGWFVFPEDSPGNAHDVNNACDCKAKKTTGLLRWCPCSCHGLGGPREKE